MKLNHLLSISTPWFNGAFPPSTNHVNKSGRKRTSVFSRHSLRVVIAVCLFFICVPQIAYPQEKTQKFAHLQFPDEIKAVKVTPRYAFAHSNNKIWRIDRDKLTIEEIAKIEGKSWNTQIQGIAADNNNLYYYVNGEGIYSIPLEGTTSTLVRPKSDTFTHKIEEDYESMDIDPSGKYLLLYGRHENVAVFDILNDMNPICAYKDFIYDAHWLNNMLWCGTWGKVVVNNRKGKSLDNQDFINYDTNDQHGITKIYLQKDNILPNMGEIEMSIGDPGELKRLLYNKSNGDLLLCTSSFDKSNIYKISTTGAEHVATINDSFSDFAAYGNKIVACGGGFVEGTYGDKTPQELKRAAIITDIQKPLLWKGATPKPYEIWRCNFMDFDKDGNLWIISNRDLFVKYK